ncbi:MAG: prepilin-type N-terminal cleavage/methylation domain-containing protein [Desulfitobacteriaceae bacterium]|nr:prepilin-type N-terminal cleavage/methylation domain-containing protein [Desulfitobacteriaceae bacterium]MDI6878472.1 prepilin-type N-terminal cleavage/methylation domain-containing protein [Desulfitobacteriaceae bacterium]MDI6913009.1 prepilin-type N-terminal cleavage/methylation domain-containing protein [Desulfitobacteriaceae bacterium]
MGFISKKYWVKTERGMTLVEVLLALAILAGAGFTMLVKIPLDFQGQALNLSGTMLLEDIRDARQAALSENTWYQVKFALAQRSYRIYREGVKVKEVSLTDGVRFYNTPQDFILDASGNPLPGTTISLVNQAGRTRKVVVAPVGGRIREE